MAKGVVVTEQPEEVTEKAKVEVLSQLGASSVQERRMEVQQPGLSVS